MAENKGKPEEPKAEVAPEEAPKDAEPATEAQTAEEPKAEEVAADDTRQAALSALLAGSAETADPTAVAKPKVKETGNTVDFGGDVRALVLARYVNLDVGHGDRRRHVIANRGDTITAPADYVRRAEAVKAVRRL